MPNINELLNIAMGGISILTMENPFFKGWNRIS